MANTAAPWFSLDHLGARLLAILAQLTALSDRLYWGGYGPLIKACLLVAAVGAVFICALAFTSDKDVEIWSDLATTGRWVGGVAIVTVFVVWAGEQGML